MHLPTSSLLLGSADKDFLEQIRDLIDRASSRSAHDSLTQVMQQMCDYLGADDAAWFVMRQMPDSAELSNARRAVSEILGGAVPVYAHYLNPNKNMEVLVSRWYRLAVKGGLDFLTQELRRHKGCCRIAIRTDLTRYGDVEEHWLYTKYLPLLGSYDRMVGMAPLDRVAESCFVFDRAPGRGVFGEREKLILNLVFYLTSRLQWLVALERGAVVAETMLSPREADTYRWLLTDMSEAEIADHMGLSAHTIHDYTGRVYKKFGVNGRVGLLAMVLGER